jgi:CheY-like chemotaxis protein
MRILVVEDEALVAMEIEMMIDLAGHEAVAQADDLNSALSAVAAARPDLALVDIQLAGGCSGLDVAAALKAHRVPVVFATGNCPREQGRDLALGCLHKPVTDSTLAAALAAAAALLEGAPIPPLPTSLHLYVGGQSST